MELKRFGSNIMVGNELTIKVENGKAKLPESFWKLDLALKVEVTKIEGVGKQEDFLQSRLFYKERREVDVVWDNQSNSFKNCNYKCVTEDIYMPNYSIRTSYGKSSLLRLKKGFNKEKVASKNHNLSHQFTNSSEDQINITGDYINTNFTEGYIYIQYSGLALTEDGKDLMIPECQSGRIAEYLIYYCRQRILEDLIIGDDDPNKIKMLAYFEGKTDDAFKLALSDSQWHGMAGWKQAMKKAKHRDMVRYDNMLINR
ncbi:structural protein [Cellulophaga phage phi17:2_18]|nr:virion structural protein [Cellulophaga phage phi17:2]AGO47577.1 structural protein [Cellulophaga phage phi17:2]ALO80447.1 structural protein [Cellulophaga phage phi17:2_18]